MNDITFPNGEYMSSGTKHACKENIFLAMANSLPEGLQTCEICSHVLQECMEELKTKRIKL